VPVLTTEGTQVADEEPQSIGQRFGTMAPDDVIAAYVRLSGSGGVPKEQAAEFLGSERLVRELTARGMAHVLPHTPSAPATFQAAPPAMALAAVVGDFQKLVFAQQTELLDGFRSLAAERSRAVPVTDGSPDYLVRVLTDRNEIMQVSGHLINSAQHDWITLETQKTEMPITDDYPIDSLAALRRGVRIRSIYNTAFAEHPQASQFIERAVALGEEARILPRVPMKIQLADDAAVLLPLTETGATGALYIEGTPIPRTMRILAEVLWSQGTPFGAAESGGPLSATERRILEHMATGKTDKAIGQAMNPKMSDTTVRRHTKAIADRLGLAHPSRYAIGHAIASRGWLTCPAADPATREEHHA
jgi:DNA-binding CsgD family transcriptional regulator